MTLSVLSRFILSQDTTTLLVPRSLFVYVTSTYDSHVLTASFINVRIYTAFMQNVVIRPRIFMRFRNSVTIIQKNGVYILYLSGLYLVTTALIQIFAIFLVT